MKRILLLVITGLGLAATVQAQTSKPAKTQKSHKHTVKHSRTTTTSTGAGSKTSLNQRKMYHWKSGQAATPTGNEATGINETQAVSKDADKAKGGGNNGRHGQK